jgi:hypothetical protein
MWAALQIIFGGILLLAGRRLYWLLAAGAGFVLGFLLAQRILQEQPQTTIMIVALVVAVIFAVLAVVGQKFVIGLVGFIAGGIGLLRLLELLDVGAIEVTTVLGIVVFLVGGILGAILLAKLFDLGLIILSSLVGAQIVLAGLEQLFAPAGDLGMIALVILMAVGLLVQLGALRRH